MNCRSVPEKVSDFLVRCSGRKYCDSCIQERLGLRWRQQVQLITATLAVTTSFERELGQCCICDEKKQVIYAHLIDANGTSGSASDGPIYPAAASRMKRPIQSDNDRDRA
jgi:hypothetical protein